MQCRRSIPERTLTQAWRWQPPSASCSKRLLHNSQLSKRSYTTRPPIQPCIIGRTSLRRPNLDHDQLKILREAHRRQLSAQTKTSIKNQVRFVLTWSVFIWASALGGLVLYQAFRQDWLDRLYPSPGSWGFVTKLLWRGGQHELKTEGFGSGFVDWGVVGSSMREVLMRLEEEDGVEFPRDYDRSIPGLPDKDEMLDNTNLPVPVLPDGKPAWRSRVGADISRKDEAWRTGYFEAYMLLAKASQINEGHMVHKTSRQDIPPQYVRSESNPWPRPLPPNKSLSRNPDESECDRSFAPPGFHYAKLLTTKGLHRQQRMQAAIAYAQWLEHNERPSEAEQLCRWSLDLAIQGLPQQEAPQIVDSKTGVLQPNAPYVSPNLLVATEALASLLARTGKISDALPIYISLLRARQTAPAAPVSRAYPPKGIDYSLGSAMSVIQWLKALPFGYEPFPNPITALKEGDEPFERTAADTCEEAALMTYVGEVLFARANRKKEGLKWTKEASTLAEDGKTLDRQQGPSGGLMDDKLDKAAHKRCEQCFRASLQNWINMARYIADEVEGVDSKTAPSATVQTEQQQPRLLDSPDPSPASKSKGWLDYVLWNGKRAPSWMKNHDWRAEQLEVEQRLGLFESTVLNNRLKAMIRHKSKIAPF